MFEDRELKKLEKKLASKKKESEDDDFMADVFGEEKDTATPRDTKDASKKVTKELAPQVKEEQPPQAKEEQPPQEKEEVKETKPPSDFPEDDEEGAQELKIFAVTTPIGQERAAADSMLPRINPAKQGIVSLLCPTKLRGFILVEAYDVRELKRIVKGVPKVRRVVEGERLISMEEIEKFLTPKPVLEGIRPGNIVELVSGPFKGEKAKVQHVDNDKEEITVELFEAMVPIPVTVKGEHVRLVDK